MEYLIDSWSLIVILLAAFVIGWAAETAQTFIPRALALSILAWLQTLPEFAVEAAIAWNQQRDLMIANLTGSLRLLVGLGWPMIFFVHFFYQGLRKKKFIREIVLDDEEFLAVLFLFLSFLYFCYVLAKQTLTCWDSVWLTLIYFTYLYLAIKLPGAELDEDDHDDLPWVGKQLVKLPHTPKVIAVLGLFAVGGAALYFTVHPFIHTLERWALAWGISSFIFIQWVAPFLSEFPEKVTAFNWARQTKKAPMAVMNMVNSNINQWTMLAAMIPIVFNLSLGRFEPVALDHMHWMELALTIAQSFLAGLLILDLRFSLWEAAAIFVLWLVQFLDGHLREEIAIVYVVWSVIVMLQTIFNYAKYRKLPRAVSAGMRAVTAFRAG